MRSRVLKLWMGMMCLSGLALSGPASATLILEVLPTSVSTALIQGSGPISVAGPVSQILLNGATSTGNSGFDSFSGTLTLGGVSPASVFTEGGTTNFAINFPSALGIGDALAGTMTATLDVESWAPVGTTGSLGSRPGGTILGSYTIVSSFSSVPEPTTLLLLGLGLAGLGFTRRRLH